MINFTDFNKIRIVPASEPVDTEITSDTINPSEYEYFWYINIRGIRVLLLRVLLFVIV